MQFKLTKSKKNFHKVSLVNKPHFFWMLLLFMMTAIISVSSAFGFFLFLRVNKEPVLPSTGSFGKVETVDRAKLSLVLEYFYKREEKMNDILYSPLPLVDPSL